MAIALMRESHLPVWEGDEIAMKVHEGDLETLNYLHVGLSHEMPDGTVYNFKVPYALFITYIARDKKHVDSGDLKLYHDDKSRTDRADIGSRRTKPTKGKKDAS